MLPVLEFRDIARLAFCFNTSLQQRYSLHRRPFVAQTCDYIPVYMDAPRALRPEGTLTRLSLRLPTRLTLARSGKLAGARAPRKHRHRNSKSARKHGISCKASEPGKAATLRWHLSFTDLNSCILVCMSFLPGLQTCCCQHSSCRG